MNQPKQQGGVLLPEIAQTFPKELQDTFVNQGFPCQICENRFTVSVRNAEGKKSKTWASGAVFWGDSLCEVLIFKCPTCGQPAAIVPVSKRELFKDAVQSTGQHNKTLPYAPKPGTPGAAQAHTTIQRIEVKKPGNKK